MINSILSLCRCSYEFKVTPKNELGSGPASEPVTFSTESGKRRRNVKLIQYEYIVCSEYVSESQLKVSDLNPQSGLRSL